MAAWFAEDASLQMYSFLTNNYPCSPLQEAIRTWSRVLLSHLTITVLCSRLSSESYRGICHAGKLAVTKRSTSRHIICYFGPGVWQIMVTLRMSHWWQWLASYAENAEKLEWVIMSLLLNSNRRNNFVFSLITAVISTKKGDQKGNVWGIILLNRPRKLSLHCICSLLLIVYELCVQSANVSIIRFVFSLVIITELSI